MADQDPSGRKRDGRFVAGVSGNPKGRPPKRNRTDDHTDEATLPDSARQSPVKNDAAREITLDAETHRFLLQKAREDGWNSLITGLGRSDYDKRMSVSFGNVCPLDDCTIRNLWRGNHLARKIITKLPTHEIRAGFALKIKDDDSAEGDGEDPEETDVEARSDARARRTDAYVDDDGNVHADAFPPKPGATSQPLPMQLSPEVEAAKELGAQRRAERAKAAENASERVATVMDMWKRLQVMTKLREARNYQRAYGGASIVLGAIDNGTPDQPLDLARVREFTFLTVLEAGEFVPYWYYSDPMAPKYGEVEVWQVTPYTPGAASPKSMKATLGRPQTTLIHESRLIYFPGAKVSRLVQHGTRGHGDSVLTPVHDVLRDYGIGWAGAAILLSDMAQAVYKMKGLAALLTADNADDFVERMRNMERSRSVARVTLIDKEDEFERKAVSFAGISDMFREFRTEVAGAADMPVSELFGDHATGGLSDTGEGARTSWFGDVAASREENVIPALTRITEICLQVSGGIPDSWCVEGNPLEQESKKDKAEREKLEAEADHIRIDDAVVSPEEVALSRFADGQGPLRVDFEAREALEAAAAKPVTTEGKDPDLEPPPMPMGPDGLPIQPKPAEKTAPPKAMKR